MDLAVKSNSSLSIDVAF